MLQVRKSAIRTILIHQQKVGSSRNSSRTEFVRFAIKNWPFIYKKWFKLHPKIWLFGPNQVYPKSVHSVHTQKMVNLFFWKQNRDSQYSYFKEQIWFWSNPPKNASTVPIIAADFHILKNQFLALILQRFFLKICFKFGRLPFVQF